MPSGSRSNVISGLSLGAALEPAPADQELTGLSAAGTSGLDVPVTERARPANDGSVDRSAAPGSAAELLSAAVARFAVPAAPLDDRQAKETTIRREAAAANFTDLSLAIMIVDEELCVMFANGAARRLLADDDRLRLERSMLVGGGALLLQPLIASALGAAELAETQRPTVELPRGSRPPLHVRVVPLQPQSNAVGENGKCGVAMLIVCDPERDAARDRERLRGRFGLTAAEAEFALEIVKGDGRQAAATRRGIAASTARSHLSAIFEKTGTRRQAELVRLLLQSGIMATRD